MIEYKLLNSASHKITVTSTATSLKDLMDTAGSVVNDLPLKLDAVDIFVESGSVRYLVDNTPTAAIGALLKDQSIHRLRGVRLDKMKLISTSGSAVLTVVVGEKEPGESSSASLNGNAVNSSSSSAYSSYEPKKFTISGAQTDYDVKTLQSMFATVTSATYAEIYVNVDCTVKVNVNTAPATTLFAGFSTPFQLSGITNLFLTTTGDTIVQIRLFA